MVRRVHKVGPGHILGIPFSSRDLLIRGNICYVARFLSEVNTS